MPFAAILGQERAVALLRRAWMEGRVPQAYCFTGPAGVGRRGAALALAQALNCLAPVGDPAVDACGACRSCRKVAAGEHPDVTLVTPAEKTVITIDQIRVVSARAALRPYEGAVKVWILDPAEQLQEAAANALLKTLEEPAGQALFVLVASGFHGLLPTIRSRCQEVRFDPLPDAALRAILTAHGRTPAEAAAVAALADGSAERALALDPADAAADRERAVTDLLAALGPLPRLLDHAERLGKDRVGFQATLELLAGVTRDLAILTASEPAADRLPPARRPVLVPLAEAVPRGAALRLHAAVADAAAALERNALPRFVAERMLMRMRDACKRDDE
jgi:DNA polymerase III subunit delta'